MDWLERLTEHPGPFATVCTDVTRDGPAPGPLHRPARGPAHEDRLTALGAPPELVDEISRVLRAPTRRGGRTHRVVVASADSVLLDQVLPARWVTDLAPQERCTWGPLPDLVPVVRELARSTSCLLVEIGADGTHLLVVSSRGDGLEAATVLEDRDVMAQVPGGGWVHSRFAADGDTRVEAEVVAHRVDDLAGRHRPDLVLVVGDDGPVQDVLGRCTAIDGPVVRVGWPPLGGPRARVQELTRVLDGSSRERDEEVLARIGSRPDGSRAVTGLARVVAALQRAEVDELVLGHDGPDGRLWATGRPRQLATSPVALVGGVDRPVAVDADVALVWAAIGTGAGVTSVPPGLGGDLEDGVGALLRPAAGSRVAASVPRTYT